MQSEVIGTIRDKAYDKLFKGNCQNKKTPSGEEILAVDASDRHC